VRLRMALSMLAVLMPLGHPTAALLYRSTLADDVPGVVGDLHLQTELPAQQAVAHWEIPLPAELWWLAVLGALALVAYHFRDILPGFRSAGEGEWDDAAAAEGEAQPERAGAVMRAADELARDGQFAEAMHVLLLEGLAEMRRRLDARFADSLTSREILRGARISEGGRAALRDIVLRVERTHFGEHPAAVDDYLACRDSFDRFARALAGAAA
jgi:hypothetical protein